MSKICRYSKLILYILVTLTVLFFGVVFVQALLCPRYYQPEPDPQIVQIAPDGEGDDKAVIYRQTLGESRWNQPVCAITATRISFSVYLDSTLLYTYDPGAFDHGEMIHWIPLSDMELSGHTLTVSAASSGVSIQVGDYSDLLLYYRNINIPAQVFSGLFLVLGILIGVMSLGASTAMKGRKIWILRHLSTLTMLMGVWVSMDAAVFQTFTARGAAMYVLTVYAFMSMPFFLIQFYRSLLDEDSHLLCLLSRLHLLDLFLSGLLQALGVVRLYEMLPLTHALMLVTLFSLLWYLVSRLHSEFRWEAGVMLSGFGLLGICCIVGLLDYYLWELRWYPILVSVGMLLFVVSLLVVAIRYVYREMVKSSRLRYYQKLANTDMMTRLDSRTSFEERIRQSPVLKGSCACLVMDINDLKKANDTMGHLAGDELICDAAECILSIFEPLGSCYRIGGDEFVVLLQDITEDQVDSTLSELELCISRRNLIRPFPLSVAVGYAMDEDASIEQMFREADFNMYQKKRQMKGYAV